MKSLLLITNFLIMTLLVLAEKDDGIPYEFGFTIDGQQHRHEKKDVNGIIQGEFGFITADGIYHVTVYATDENGNFKILSMRNIRVSDPLGGSAPLKQPQSISKQPQIQLQNPVTPANSVVEITTRKYTTPYVFTTSPTIRSACASCGIVTTLKPKPNQPFPFQTPEFQNSPGQDLDPKQDTSPNNDPSQDPTYNSYPNQDPNYPNDPPQDSKYYNEPNQVPNYPNPDPAFFEPQNPEISVITQDQIKPPTRTPLSQVSVTEGVIHVPGNPDIPIQDKYPGMANGLPNGINENDITDLLYKFNYTVGFHGHYEKGYKNGAKVGGYFVNGRDGISRVVTYVADENGFRPKFKFIRLGLDSADAPKEDTEKTFGLKNFEFIWYPVS